MLQTIKGSAHFEQKQYDESIKANREALGLDAANNWARYNLALTLMQKSPAEAAAAWHEYLDKAAADPAHAGLLEDARHQLAQVEGKKTK
jgi:cytochrome c-type biogenesis protein CcmH/NrfG